MLPANFLTKFPYFAQVPSMPLSPLFQILGPPLTQPYGTLQPRIPENPYRKLEYDFRDQGVLPGLI